MRNASLDVLRFVAIALVLGRHMRINDAPHAFLPFLETWRRGGWVGVDLFFVLSGFLVSGLLFREYEKCGSVGVGRFLVRRGFKIYPAFWALIAATIVVGFAEKGNISERAVAIELAFVQCYLPGFWNHTWSLAVEEHFYLLLSAAVWFGIRLKRGSDPFGQVPIVVAGIGIACLIFRYWSVERFGLAAHYHYLFPTHLRIDSLAFGVLLCWMWERGHLVKFVDSAWKRAALIATGILCLMPAFIFTLEETRWIPIFGLPLFALGSGCILLGLLKVPVAQVAVFRKLAWVGFFSYSIYLWHMPVERWIAARIAVWYVYAAVYILGSFAIGVVLARLIEAPTLKLRERFFPAHSHAVAVSRQTTAIDERDVAFASPLGQ